MHRPFPTLPPVIVRSLVRRRRRAAALALGGLSDPLALSRLEMHGLAAAAFYERTDLAKRHPVETIHSLFAIGDRKAALEAGAAAAARTKPALALAIAKIEPRAALGKFRGDNDSLMAGLLAASGEHGQALAIAQFLPGAEGRFLSASLAKEDSRRSSAAWSQGFAAFQMPPPSRIDENLPFTVANATGSPSASITGPLVTVIMPAYNAAPYVAAAVRSILAQGWNNLELLLVNDQSTDDTVVRALDAAEGDRRVRIIDVERRGGPYRARNLAMAQARGRYIVFHDADEWSHPDRLHLQVAAMERNGLAACSSRGLRVDASGGVRARGVWPLVRWAPSTLAIRRTEALARVGYMDEVLSGADNEYWWRLSLAFGPSRVAIMPQPLIVGAWRADSLTGSAESGFGGKGYNLDRLAYWEAWNLWHMTCWRRSGGLRLTPGDRPFPIPRGIEMHDFG